MTRPARPGPVVHATDFSAASGPALASAMDWARRERAPLLLLHVLTPPSPFVNEARPPASYLELQARARGHASRQLGRLVERVERRGIPAQARLLEGVPAGEIARAARRVGARALVIGTHGRTGLGRALMGSVAEAVLATAPCPVLTVRGRPRGERR